jgi:hypothetical protein
MKKAGWATCTKNFYCSLLYQRNLMFDVDSEPSFYKTKEFAPEGMGNSGACLSHLAHYRLRRGSGFQPLPIETEPWWQAYIPWVKPVASHACTRWHNWPEAQACIAQAPPLPYFSPILEFRRANEFEELETYGELKGSSKIQIVWGYLEQNTCYSAIRFVYLGQNHFLRTRK